MLIFKNVIEIKIILLLCFLFPTIAFSAVSISPINKKSINSKKESLLRLTSIKQKDDASFGRNKYDPQNLFGTTNTYERAAFSDMSRQALPLTPDQIVKLKKMLAVTQRASASLGVVPPKPTLSTQEVSLAPGAMPPIICLQQGFVTSVVFVDSSGASWPIESYDLGNPRAFDIQWKQGSNSNLLMIQALTMYTYGNLAVKLKGLSTPIMLTLLPGQKVVNYRVDLRINQRNPNTKPLYTRNTPTAETNNVLLNVLDGIAPPGGKPLNVVGGQGRAWLIGNKMYVRTRLTIISPSWLSIMSSPDGTKAYLMERSSTVLVSKYGDPVELKLEEK